MVWSKRLSPSGASGSSRPRSRRAAIAMPTALPTPWPSGPVVVSTPGVWLTSGWPGVCEPQVRSALQVVELHAVAGEVELDVERQARVAHRQHEAVAAGPVRVARVVPQPLLEEQVGGRGHAHRRPRVAVADLLDGVHRQDAGGVDRPAVELAEAVGEGRASAAPGCRWGRRVAASAGASGSVLCVMCWVLPRGRPCVVRPAFVRVVRTGAGPGRTVVVDVGPTRCTRSINAINPSHPRSCRAGRRTPRGLQWPPFPSPVRKGPRAVQVRECPAARALPRTRAPVTALSERQTDPARRMPAVLRARVGAYVALTKPRIIELLLVTTVPAMMLAARGWPSWRCCWPRSSAAPSPRARPTSSTATSTATSTG